MYRIQTLLRFGLAIQSLFTACFTIAYVAGAIRGVFDADFTFYVGTFLLIYNYAAILAIKITLEKLTDIIN